MAGLLDGEGSIGIYYDLARDRYELIVSIANSYENIVDILKEQFGGHKTKTKGTNKWVYHWVIKAKLTEKFLKMMHPHLIIKKKQAEIALLFRDTFVHVGRSRPLSEAIMLRREILYQKIRVLNL